MGWLHQAGPLFVFCPRSQMAKAALLHDVIPGSSPGGGFGGLAEWSMQPIYTRSRFLPFAGSSPAPTAYFDLFRTILPALFRRTFLMYSDIVRSLAIAAFLTIS